MQNFSYPEPKIFPVIDLGDIILREKQESDVEDFFHYYSNPRVNQYILCEIPKNLDQAKQELLYWRGAFYRNDGIYFAIATKHDNRMIGAIGLTTHNTYHQRIELSYDLSEEFWHQGIMTHAVAAITEFGFKEYQVNRIEAFTATGNIASKKLLLRSGFKFEGTLRQHRYHRGTYVDADSFSFLWQDYCQNAANHNKII